MSTTIPTEEYHALVEQTEYASAYENMAVMYKDLLIDVAEGKMSLSELKEYVQYLERGHDQ